MPPMPQPHNQRMNIGEFTKILSELNGSNASINNACKWMMQHNTASNAKTICDAIRAYFVQQTHSFDKKLFVLFMINDVLHQCVKMDTLSLCLSDILISDLLPISFLNYSPQQQQKVNFLLNLWTERQIFSADLLHKLRQAMIGNPILNNSLSLSIGDVVQMALDLRRTG